VTTYNFPDELVTLLQNARQITVLTGAGISAESGLPTFRDALTGLWAKYDPHELATEDAFRRNPKLVWDWYAMRRDMVQGATPNPGHYALAEMERRAAKFELFTQNIDGMHRLAGSQNVTELHGSLQNFKCFADGTPVPPEEWLTPHDYLPPRCPRCDAFVRPDIVWFGESLPLPALQAAATATLECDVFFSIGTSGTVYPAAALPLNALEAGATVVTLNLEVATEVLPHRFNFNGKAGEILPALVAAVWGA
jgi:NAD-dependent deacetylase